jgi:hypothetical protein
VAKRHCARFKKRKTPGTYHPRNLHVPPRNLKILAWCGFPAKKGWKAAPLLDFQFSALKR